MKQVKAVIDEEIEHGLHARLHHAREAQKASIEPIKASDVPAARERASAELGFVTFVEGLRQAARGGTGHVD